VSIIDNKCNSFMLFRDLYSIGNNFYLFNLNSIMRFTPVTEVSSRSMFGTTAKFIVFLCLCTILQISSGIHLQAQPVDQNANAYNKNLYLRELSGI
jgi:hypothetical protein